MTRQNIEYLRNNGPATNAELPYKIAPTDRQLGVWRLHITTTGSGDGASGGGSKRAVYYLREEHDYERVVQKWCDVNSGFLRENSPRAVRQNLRDVGREFHDAIDAVVPLEAGDE